MRVLYHGRNSFLPLERRVKGVIKCLVLCENQRSVNTIPSLLNDKISPKTRILQSFVIVTCLAACVCQIWLRFVYYLKSPVRMDVFYEEVEEREMPMLTLCTRDTEAYLEYLKTHPSKNPRPCYPSVTAESVVNCNDSVEKLWNLLDTKTIIRDAFIAKSNKRLSNMTFDTINSVSGACAQIFSEMKVQFGNPSVRMHVLLKCPILENDFCQSPTVQTTVQLIGSKLLEVQSVIMFTTDRKLVIPFEIYRYEFLNKTNDRCISKEAYEECLLTCYCNMQSKFNDTCRLPYEAYGNYEYLPHCNCSKETALRHEMAVQKMTAFSPFSSCQCDRACTMTELITFAYIDVTEKEYVEIYSQNNILRKMVEKHAYSGISLLCDVGGNINLYFGLSVLSFIDLITRCWQFRQNQKKILRVPNSYTLKKTFFHVFKTEFVNRQKATVYDNSLFFKIESVFKYAVCVISAILCIYQIFDRVDYYFSYPNSISITVTEDQKIQLPAIVTCYLPQIIHTAKEKFSRHKNITCDNVELLDLLDKPSEYAHNIEKLWNKTSTIEHFEKLPGSLFTYGNWSSFATIQGTCTKSELDIKNFGIFINLLTMFSQTTSCGCHYNVFVVPVGESFDLRHYISLPCTGNSYTKFRKQTQRKAFTPKTPCVSRTEAIACREKCFKNKMMETATCKFPFMSSVSLKLCNSSQSAKLAKQIYLTAYMNTNPLVDCNCHPRCEDTIYLHHTHHEYKKNMLGYTGALYSMRSNVREVIQQELTFPLNKLLCDIGSSLGIMVGMSVFSLIHLTQKTICNLSIKLKTSIQ